MFSRGGRGHGRGGLDKGGGHLRGHGRGSGRTRRGNLPHQAHASVDPDVGVALSSHVEHFQAIVVQTRELALERPLAIRTADSYRSLGVEYR